MADAPAKPRSRRRILAVAAGVLLVLLAALYLSRKLIAREALTGWLRSKGVASELEVQRLGPGGATARLRVGDPAHPDFTADVAELTYGWRGLSFEVRSVKLRRAVLRARLHDGKLSAGALNPLIAEFRKRPPKPGAAKPRIEIDDGVVLLATDYGPVRATADALVQDGKLLRLAAVTAPAALKGRAFEANLGPGRLTEVTRADRVELALDAPIVSGRAGSGSIQGGRLQAAAAGPYPDLQKKRGEGGVVLHANLTARSLGLAGQDLADAQLSAGFTGRTTGWIPDLVLTGAGTADLRASSASAGPARIGTLRAAAAVTDIRWTRKGGDALAAQLKLTGLADQVIAQDLTLQRVSAAMQGPLKADRQGVSLSLLGDANGHGAWRGLGAAAAADSREIAAVNRAARGFAFAASDVALSTHGLDLRGPVTVRPDRGGEARIAPAGGGYRLTVAGGGLPKVEARVDRFALVEGGAVAGGKVHAQLSIGPIEGGDFDASGTLRIGDGVRFSADRCVGVKAAKLELGENDVEALSGRLCPAGGPVLTLAGGGWSIGGRYEAVAAEVPFLQARVSGAAGRAAFGESGGRLHATAAITEAQVADTAAERRFNPLRMSGRAALAREVWTADLAFRTPAGAQVAQARLQHDGRTGAGGVEVDTGRLAFAEGGLQPAQLSPLAEAVGSPAAGEARFVGGFLWAKAGTTSGGTLSIPRLDFDSPAGRVTGLSGEVVFTSLTPLTAAPGQVLKAEGIAAAAPLANVTATFGVADEALHVSGGEAAVGGGRVRIESLDVPLTAGAAIKGVLLFEGVQLHDLMEASPFGDYVDLDAKVSGRVPFESRAGKVRISGGELKAIAPGRLSIRRTALDAPTATGRVEAPVAAAAVPPTSSDTFTDFAYQAMENLAFDTLDASIGSREDGRLGVLFHIVGRHDPPQHQELKISLLDLIQKKFLGRKLPLPSGTSVNLTLDTSLNLDELLRDYAEYQRLRGSGPVQPPGP